MATYTTQVKTICEKYYMDANGCTVSDLWSVNVREIIKNAYPKIFDVFPIWGGGDAEKLGCDIIAHYYMREIGMETVALWLFELNNRMGEIMPYYVNVVESTLKFKDVFVTEDKTETHSRELSEDTQSTNTENTTITDTGNQHEDSTNNVETKESDTPQNGLKGIREDNYLTNASGEYTEYVKNANDSNTNTKTGSITKRGSRDENEDISINRKGFSGNKVELMKTYRETILNVEKMIIDDLADLFFGLI